MFTEYGSKYENIPYGANSSSQQFFNKLPSSSNDDTGQNLVFSTILVRNCIDSATSGFQSTKFPSKNKKHSS